jgi:hypothetical protein
MVTVVGKPLSRPKVRKFTDHAVSLHHDLLAELISDDPFPATDRNRFRRLIVDCNKINKWIWPVWRRLERWHINEFIDRHAEIGQFAKHCTHEFILRHIQ